VEPPVDDPEPIDEAPIRNEEPISTEPTNETNAPNSGEPQAADSDQGPGLPAGESGRNPSHETNQAAAESQPTPALRGEYRAPDVDFDASTTYLEPGAATLAGPQRDDEVAALYVSADTAAGRLVSPMDEGYLSPTSYLFLAAVIAALLNLLVRWGDRQR
jgi:hypothetical protein